MSQNIVAALIIAGAILILAAVLYFKQRQYAKARAQVARERAEREETERKRKVSAQQNALGDILFQALSEAARRNTRVNYLPSGDRAREAGTLEIERIKDNGGKYTIVASIPDPTCSTLGGLTKRGYSILQVNINLTGPEGHEIHVMKAPYGPSCDYGQQHFDYVRTKLHEWLTNYRLFPGDNPSMVGEEIFDKNCIPAA